MTGTTFESELMTALKAHEDLVQSCVTGAITFAQFRERYGDFYVSHALDGHESNGEQQNLLGRVGWRVSLHRAIYDQVLCHVTSDDLLEAHGAREAGFIGSDEAFQRLCSIWHDWRSKYREQGNP